VIQSISRRQAIKGGAALLGLAAFEFPRWMLPALGQGEEVVPWTDIPENFNPHPPTGAPSLDTRALQSSSFITPTEEFFAVQHYAQAQVDPAAYKLRVTGLVNKPMELTLDQLKSRPRLENIIGFECSGNTPVRLNTLLGNARWAGTSLNALIKDAGLQRTAREVVFFGADQGTEDIIHGGPSAKYDQTFARSLAVEDAEQPDIFIAWEMNGAPLSVAHGAPVRLIVPGWYGIANVKWLDHIHAQDSRFMGRFMARDYVTIMGTKEGDETIWNETSVGRMRVKSMVARLTRDGNSLTAGGFALTDGTPLRSVEVRLDEGPWQRAVMDRANTRYSWQLFTCRFSALASGAHTIVSRATDTNGTVQPEAADLALKKSRWENNGQFVRKFQT
jgi:DMSO/TMAO reductase YedYZ molybdopterin-dependent catalytic subunit